VAELKGGQITAVVGGREIACWKEMTFNNFHFDSRLLNEQGLFFALSGERGDGHDYLGKVAEKPGCAAIVNKIEKVPPGLPALFVDDVLQALHKIASFVRDQNRKTLFIAITGSAGKTSTKEFAATLLAKGGKVHKSPGNWNNWLGLPFSLLELAGDERYAVFELAMSQPGIGEISTLASILKPDIGVILNVYPVHLEFLKTIENIAHAKCELLAGIAAGGAALINGDNDCLKAEADKYPVKKLFFGRGPGNDIVWRNSETTGSETVLSLEFEACLEKFPVPIAHGVLLENAFVAVVIARQAGLSAMLIRQGLRELQAVPGRGVIHQLADITLVDETYNSNPEALKQVMKWVAGNYSGLKVAVIGDMLELGPEEDSFHYRLGQDFAGLGFACLVTVGRRALHFRQGALDAGFPEDSTAVFIDPRAAGRHLLANISSGTTVLLKGSRGMKLELAMEELLNG